MVFDQSVIRGGDLKTMFIFSDFILFQLHDPPLLSLTSPPSPYSARHSKDQVLLSCNITAFPAPEVIVWHLCWEGRMQEILFC